MIFDFGRQVRTESMRIEHLLEADAKFGGSVLHEILGLHKEFPLGPSPSRPPRPSSKRLTPPQLMGLQISRTKYDRNESSSVRFDTMTARYLKLEEIIRATRN